jgi:hydrogenase maturation factor HypF (carbamoyltransferase family)
MRRVHPNPEARAKPVSQSPRMYLIPCSCGATFSVAAQYDQCGSAWSRFLICPECGKRHDPRNRLLQLGYHREGYWKVDGC